MTELSAPVVGRLREPDMSPEAIDRRLRAVDDLYELGLSLRDAPLVGVKVDRQTGSQARGKDAPDYG